MVSLTKPRKKEKKHWQHDLKSLQPALQLSQYFQVDTRGYAQPSRHLLVPNKQWKHQNNKQNLFIFTQFYKHHFIFS